MIIVGFTGTQIGMTPQQAYLVNAALEEMLPGEFHHGDCIGADEQAAGIARGLGMRLVCHPPRVSMKRAFVKSDEERPPLPYLQRNTQIVACTSMLIATPKGAEETRSGTWSTVRYARRLKRRRLIIFPDGKWSAEERI